VAVVAEVGEVVTEVAMEVVMEVAMEVVDLEGVVHSAVMSVMKLDTLLVIVEKDVVVEAVEVETDQGLLAVIVVVEAEVDQLHQPLDEDALPQDQHHGQSPEINTCQT